MGHGSCSRLVQIVTDDMIPKAPSMLKSCRLLTALRSPHVYVRFVAVDTLCSSQHGAVEKSAEVLMVLMIYHRKVVKRQHRAQVASQLLQNVNQRTLHAETTLCYATPCETFLARNTDRTTREQKVLEF